MGNVIRTGYSIEGVCVQCTEVKPGMFHVLSRWQRFHKTEDIREALVVLEGLCLEEFPTRDHAKRLVQEARRNKRHSFITEAAWERRVIECARRRSEGLRPVLGGSKHSVEQWVPAGAFA